MKKVWGSVEGRQGGGDEDKGARTDGPYQFSISRHGYGTNIYQLLSKVGDVRAADVKSGFLICF